MVLECWSNHRRSAGATLTRSLPSRTDRGRHRMGLASRTRKMLGKAMKFRSAVPNNRNGHSGVYAINIQRGKAIHGRGGGSPVASGMPRTPPCTRDHGDGTGGEADGGNRGATRPRGRRPFARRRTPRARPASARWRPCGGPVAARWPDAGSGDAPGTEDARRVEEAEQNGERPEAEAVTAAGVRGGRRRPWRETETEAGAGRRDGSRRPRRHRKPWCGTGNRGGSRRNVSAATSHPPARKRRDNP